MTGFQAMRSNLIKRGLIETVGEEFRLTAAGVHHAREMILRLRSMGGINDTADQALPGR